MKALVAAALFGVFIVAPAGAQIAGSGQRTQTDDLRRPVRKPPAPVSSPRAVPTLSGAPAGGYRVSPLLKVDVQAAKRLGRPSGIRIISGGRVTVVQPGQGVMPPAPKVSMRKTQMKLVRVGAGPLTTYTRYGAELDKQREAPPQRPATIRVNP